MGQSEKAGGKRPVVLTSSDTNDATVHTSKATKDLNSHHMTIWREAFDLTKLPQTIALELLKRAPFLLGTKNAKYTKQFFETVGGLCGAGIQFDSVMKEEHGVPLEEMLATYPLNKNGNRHSVKFMTDLDAARDALHMYQRVYGGTYPDNGEFGTAFIRGLVLYYQREIEVDWAEYATDLAKKRMQNPFVNPQKLTPPCLREQIQAMINVFQHYLRLAYADKDNATSQLRRANLPVMPSDFPTRQPRSAELVKTKPVVSREGRAEAPRAPYEGSASNNIPVRQQRTSARSSPLRPTNASAAWPLQLDSMAALKDRRRKTETELLRGMKHLSDAESEFKILDAKKADLILSEDANWEAMVALRANKKRCALTREESDQIEEELRKKTTTANSISQCVGDVQKQMAELQDRIQLLWRATRELQDKVGMIKADIEVAIVDTGSICPKQLFSKLPVTCTSMIKVHANVPCILCGRFWVDNAFVCLPCGCLLHPFCMFKVALSSDPRCPFCNHAPGGLWRGQWGYATDNDEMRSAISACIASMDAAGWMKPLDPLGARAKVEEMLESICEKYDKFVVLKRSTAVDNEDQNQPPPKRAHLKLESKEAMDPASLTLDEEICAIGAAVALEASSSMQ